MSFTHQEDARSLRIVVSPRANISTTVRLIIIPLASQLMTSMTYLFSYLVNFNIMGNYHALLYLYSIYPIGSKNIEYLNDISLRPQNLIRKPSCCGTMVARSCSMRVVCPLDPQSCIPPLLKHECREVIDCHAICPEVCRYNTRGGSQVMYVIFASTK